MKGSFAAYHSGCMELSHWCAEPYRVVSLVCRYVLSLKPVSGFFLFGIFYNLAKLLNTFIHCSVFNTCGADRGPNHFVLVLHSQVKSNTIMVFNCLYITEDQIGVANTR